jgi:hypothetical protein
MTPLAWTFLSVSSKDKNVRATGTLAIPCSP